MKSNHWNKGASYFICILPRYAGKVLVRCFPTPSRDRRQGIHPGSSAFEYRWNSVRLYSPWEWHWRMIPRQSYGVFDVGFPPHTAHWHAAWRFPSSLAGWQPGRWWWAECCSYSQGSLRYLAQRRGWAPEPETQADCLVGRSLPPPILHVCHSAEQLLCVAVFVAKSAVCILGTSVRTPMQGDRRDAGSIPEVHRLIILPVPDGQ